MDLSELDRLEKQVGTMKLSDALRLGAQLRSQGIRKPFHDGKSCALGAIAEALGNPYDEAVDTVEVVEFLWKFYPHRLLPDISIFARNDNGFTREQIATWLEFKGL